MLGQAWPRGSFLLERLVWNSGTWTSQAPSPGQQSRGSGGAGGSLAKALYRFELWVTLAATYPGLCHCTPRVGGLVEWRRTLATSYRLAHQSQLERNQTSPNLGLGLAFLSLEWKPTPAHQPACPRQGHTDSFPFQTGKPPPGIAGRRQPATLPGLAFGPSLWFKVCMFTGLGRERCASPELPTPQSMGHVLRPHQTVMGPFSEDYDSVNRHFLEVADV